MMDSPAKATSNCGASARLAWPPRGRSGRAPWKRRGRRAASLSSPRLGQADLPEAAVTAVPPARQAEGRAGAAG
ncbi:hypothetical protein ACQKI4_16585, partial [Paenibacillus glucanolyticus]|uniref:hypothetical protein n=1 Tax=Paenibacillus glucanolyticus TaxID=59843 RepID=UPI003CFCC46D